MNLPPLLPFFDEAAEVAIVTAAAVFVLLRTLRGSRARRARSAPG
jgi:hypothetical protein